MISFEEYNQRKQFLEFIGPQGQVDPQGLTQTNPQQAAQISRSLQTVIGQLNSLQPAQIMQLSQAFNAQVQNLIKTKQSQQTMQATTPINAF